MTLNIASQPFTVKVTKNGYFYLVYKFIVKKK